MRFGDIEKIKLARNMSTARRLDFGFVIFKTHKVAIACVEDINNDELVKGDEQVFRSLSNMAYVCYYLHISCLYEYLVNSYFRLT